jgi:hypothetical protein
MGAFTDIELEWAGKVYSIKAHRIMGAIARIEDIVTMPELQSYAARQGAPLGKLCMAYSAVLRYAGASVRDDEVYDAVFSGAGGDGILTAVMNIMELMIPASARIKIAAGEGEPVAEPAPGNRQAAAAASSKRRSKSRSRKANGSRRVSSGG